jgi:hypothetical protein
MMNLQNLIGRRKLNDENLDFLIREFATFSTNENIGYISSLQIDACLSRQRNNLFCSGKEQVLRTLGKSFYDKHKAGTLESLIITIHGPHTGNVVINGVNVNDHWSLAFYCKKLNKIYHYDSMNNLNTHKFSEIVGFFISWGIVIDERTTAHCPHSFIPQQLSNWECGHYTLMYACIIGSRRYAADETFNFTEGEDKRVVTISKNVTPISKDEINEYLRNGFFDLTDCQSEIRQKIFEFAAAKTSTSV